jgi:hypothetical protein
VSICLIVRTNVHNIAFQNHYRYLPIRTLVEDRMDILVFEDRYNNDETGRWAYDPKVLLKVVLFAYSRGSPDLLE